MPKRRGLIRRDSKEKPSVQATFDGVLVAKGGVHTNEVQTLSLSPGLFFAVIV
jgi:hypothetical protein